MSCTNWRFLTGLLLSLALVAVTMLCCTASLRERKSKETLGQAFWVDPASGNQYFVGVSYPDPVHK